MNRPTHAYTSLRHMALCLSLLTGIATAHADNWFKQFDRWLEKGMRSGIDTSYQDVPKLMNQVYVGSYVYRQNYRMNMPLFGENVNTIVPGIQDDDHYMINAHSLQAEADVAIDWKGLTLELPIPIQNKYHLALGLAKNGSVWGFRLRYKDLHQMEGDCNIGNRLINQENNSLQTFLAEGYYVLNHRKFSLAAGLYSDMIQKRSAGSPLVYLNYFQTNYSVNKTFPANSDHFQTHQLSLGAGYAYNLALMGGRLVFHASFVPMFTLYSHMEHQTDLDNGQNTSQWNEFYKAADTGHARFRINNFTRLAANYSFDRYIITFLFNHRYTGYSNDLNLQISHLDMDAQVNFCTRF